MPCRHDGGLDPCERTAHGHCVFKRQQYTRARYAPNGMRTHEGARGAAAEHLVISRLLARCLRVTKPLNPSDRHDVFVRIGRKWWTVQVKVGKVSTYTGCIHLPAGRKKIKSELIAVVDLAGKRVRWLSNTKKPIPVELDDDSLPNPTHAPKPEEGP